MNDVSPNAFPPTEERLKGALERRVGQESDIFRRSDLIQQGVYDFWSEMIPDPADTKTEDRLSRPPNHAISGVAVTVTGDAISRGRWVKTNISQTGFDRFLACDARIKGDWRLEPNWARFAGALLHAYWRVYGRDVAIAHHFLHEVAERCRIVHLDFTYRSGKSPRAPIARKLGPQYQLSRIRFNKLIDKFAFQRTEGHERAVEFFTILYKMVSRMVTERDRLTTEDYAEIAEEAYFEAASRCFVDTLQKANAELLVAINEAPSLFSTGLYNYLVSSTIPESAHDRHEKLDRLIKGLQLLMLYRKMAGDNFYVVTPPGGRHFQYVFTAWSEGEISDDTLQEISQLATALSKAVDGLAEQPSGPPRHPYQKDESSNEVKTLQSLLGKLYAEFDRQFTRSSLVLPITPNRFAGLPEYLVLAEKLSQVAVHEGRKLQFRIHVSAGTAASKHIQYVSALWEKDDEYIEWVVVPGYEESLTDEGVYPASLISRLIGNYSFFQDDSHVIQASVWGHVQYLGRILGVSEPEELTKDGDNILITIDPNADIRVFFRARLQLWRRDGKWLLPESYGQEYRDILANGILKVTGPADANSETSVKVLSKCAWELSTREHKGACFIILRGFDDWQQYFMPMTHVLRFADKRRLLTNTGMATLIQLAIQDGATVVDLDTNLVMGRRHIVVNYNTTLWHGKTERSKEWENEGLHKLLRWGTRHHSALAVALFLNTIEPNSKKAAVVTVSSDGDIHLLGPQGPIFECSYPHAVRS